MRLGRKNPAYEKARSFSMKGFVDTLKKHRVVLPAFTIAIIGVIFAVTFARGTFWLPLMGDHCMKTSKNVQVAYNIVRYGDPFSKYIDFQATPENPRGRRGAIFSFESPLSALSLAGLYALLGGEDFIRRVNIARYFTLFHLLAGYLVVALFLLRRKPFALSVLTFTLFGATFTVSYSTKPLPECYAIFYQGLFIAAGAHLLSKKIGPVKKSIIIAVLSCLLSIGGKMNYFLIALPVIIGFPFFDAELFGIKNKLKYFAIFVIGVAFASSVMLLFTDISFYDVFIFMIKGNKPIIEDSLWRTFIEGFSALDEVIKRTRTDFGRTAFDWGTAAIGYLVVKFIFIAGFKRRQTTLWQRFSVMTTLFVLGHGVNYVALRNLYIPHKYYVVPLYFIFALSITIFLTDILYILTADYPLKQRYVRPLLNDLSRKLERWAPLSESRLALSAVATSVLALIFLAIYLGYLGETLSSRGWRTTVLLAAKAFGSQMLAIDIRAAMVGVSRGMIIGMWVCFSLSGLALLALIGIWKRLGFSSRLAKVGAFFQKAGIGVMPLAFAFTLSLPVTFWILKNGKSFYDYAMSHTELVEHAQDLARIRRDTESGALVLAWKVCMAFYADKRSITDAKVEDLDYYRKHSISSVMGPKKPLNHFYKKIEKYPPPMSYWVPKEQKHLKRGPKTKK
jgi:hypothetical protein